MEEKITSLEDIKEWLNEWNSTSKHPVSQEKIDTTAEKLYRSKANSRTKQDKS